MQARSRARNQSFGAVLIVGKPAWWGSGW